MGRLPEGNRKYQITEMWDVHHEITRLLLIGMKETEIAEHLGVTPVMVSYTKNSAVVKRQLDLMRAARDVDAVDIAREIKALLPKAVKVLDETMDGQNAALRLRAAQDALDRGGHAAVRTLRTENLHAHFTSDEITDIKKRAKEIGLLTDDVFDIKELRDDRDSSGR